MVIKVGINGFGRIGRVIFRKCFENADVKLSAINDPAIDIEYICYLIKFDSTHGKFRGQISYKDNEITINDHKIKVFRERLPENVPWQTVGVQYVVEASGMFTCLEKASGHLASENVKRVIVTAPSVDIPMIILGVNDDKLKAEHKVLSCASSTLYCLAPIIKVLNDSFGVDEGFVTSIHAMTPSLKPLDGLCLRGKHWRDHRSIHQNIIPASTGACKALGKIIPEVKDKLTGLAFRVPIVNVSVLDITIRLLANTSIANIVKSIEKASDTYLQNIIKTSNENAVSSDFIGDSYSCILDVDSSLELKPNFFKVICWYENEYSYACRVLDSIFFSERRICQSMTIPKSIHLGVAHVSTETSTEHKHTNRESKSPNIDSTDIGFKDKLPQTHRSLILKHSLSPALAHDIEKKYEINKVWNDDCETCKIRKKCSSLFHCCAENNSERVECVEAKECLENVKKEFSKMVIITEDLLKKSCSKNVNLETSIKIFNKEKAWDAFKQTKIDSLKNIDDYSKRKDNKLQTNSMLLKDCGDSNINIDKEEKCYLCEKTNKTVETVSIIKDENINTNLKQCIDIDSNLLESKIDAVSNVAQTANKGEDFVIINITSTYDTYLKEPVIDTHLTDDLTIKQAENDLNKLSKRSSFSNANLFLHNSSLAKTLDGTQEQEVNTIEGDFQSDLISENINCYMKTSQCKYSLNKENEKKYDFKELVEYLESRNYNMHIIDEELKKRNIILIDSNTNPHISFIDHNKQLLVEMDDSYGEKAGLTCLNTFSPETIMVSDEFSRCGSFRNVVTLINGEEKDKKQDIFDKLDSASGTVSNDSFDINERKSQVIHITDLTSSLEDLSRLDKICRIIEISDELSDELFSALDKSDSCKIKNKQWSFKDFCERIRLDDFCNKVFGETGV